LLRLLVILAAVLGWLPPAAAQSNLPLPRFVSLKSGEVNLRTGPGPRYPIEWVLMRKDMPVEVLAEFETWRKIRDIEGTEGWVHQRMLSGRRTAIIVGGVRSLHRRDDGQTPVIANLEPGVVGTLLECKGAWCRMEAAGQKGWLQRSEFWGVYPNENFE
jgi:SH3-like domain-containing protein